MRLSQAPRITKAIQRWSLGPIPTQVPSPDYAYHCEDRSLLKPFVYKFFVSPIARRLSNKTSANDVTIWSQFFALLSIIIGLISTQRDCPRWLWAMVVPLGYLGYAVFDHVDGTHARRTKTSSPLGEFVDHWFDAWNAALLPFAWSLSWQTNPVFSVLLGAITALAYTLAMNEHRMTGTMKLERIGSNEALMLMTLTMIAMGVFGRSNVAHIRMFLGLELVDVFQLGVVVGSGGTILTIVLRQGRHILLATVPQIIGSCLILTWVALGLNAIIAGFMLATLCVITSGRIILERITGENLRADFMSLFLIFAGFALANSSLAITIHSWVGLTVTILLMVRASSDFLWGLRAFQRWLKPNEWLSLLVHVPVNKRS